MDTSGGSIRILLVEDSPEHALLVRHRLAMELGERAEVDHRGSLAAARAALAERAADCVLLDLTLPDARELEALSCIVARAPELPVVVLSGEEDEEVALRAVQKGAQDYLVKSRADGHLLARAIRYAMERKRVELELAHRATHDPLTGLPNRALLRDRLELTLARIERRERGCALLFIDLDHFKAVNDEFGHDAGDALLVQAGARIRALVRPSDTVARLGGDEFVVLCDDVAGREDAARVAERIEAALAEPFEIDRQLHRIGASVGIALAGGRDGGPEALLRDADQAMYRAKQAGGGWRM